MPHLIWTVTWRDDAAFPDVFRALATPVPMLIADGLPAEVGLLLPNRNSQAAELALAEVVGRLTEPGVVLGLFLANPFLRIGPLVAACRAAGIDWVANLPSVSQQEPEFAQQLEDVGLDLGGELKRLDALRSAGLRIAAVATDADGACRVAEMGAECLIVMPRVSDFAVGFPSSRQRGAAIQDIRAALSEAAWHGPILGLGDETEASHPGLWPEGVDGLLVRPRAANSGA